VRFLAALLVVVAACGGGSHRAEGVVVAVDGGLDGVQSFEIVTSDGERLVFEPAPGLSRFEHGAPLAHLQEHLQTGSPITVLYTESDGVLVAEAVEG
jgi:hypothetical protein